jgi:hypothetical protein
MPAEMTVEDLLKRGAKAFDRQAQWLGTWSRAYTYCRPQANQINQSPNGARKGVEVYDSTAPTSHKRLANRMQADIFPDGQRFVKLEPGSDIPPELKQKASQVLETITNKFHEAVQNSNFAMSVNEFLSEFVIGTGAMLMDKGTVAEPFKFYPAQMPYIAIDEGKYGSVDGVFIKHKMSKRAIMQTWPQATLPGAWSQKKDDDEFDLMSCCYRMGEVVCYRVLAVAEKLDLIEVYTEQQHPWIVARWSKIAGEPYGRGPPIEALADILTLNKVVEFNLQAAAYAIAGIYTVADDGVTNPNMFQIRPGVFLPVARNNGHPSGPSIAPLENGSRFDVTQLVIEDLRSNIKRAYYDQALPPDSGPVRSASEMIMRQKELSQDLGAAFGRITRELIVPLVLRGLQILSDLKLIDYPVVISATTIKVVPVSPLSQQQNLNDIEAVVKWIEISQALGQEAYMLGVKFEDVPAWTGNKLGVPVELIRDAPSRQNLQMLAAKMIAQQMQPQGAAPGAAPAAAPAGAPGPNGAMIQ